MKPGDFIDMIAPAAMESAKTTRIPASFVVAEAALESGWGESLLAKQGKNLFGVKADPAWQGDVLEMRTREFLKGRWVVVPARWRKYPDWVSCLNDHADFLRQNKRYAQCFQSADGEGFARAVAAAGYATDPQYADKIVGTMRAHSLAELDAETV